MSEAELYLIRARLRGGILAKAARGELPLPLPAGLVYDAAGHDRVGMRSGTGTHIEVFSATFS